MIQRIQSIYLLLAAGLMTAVLFLPLAVMGGGEDAARLTANGLSTGTVESMSVLTPAPLAMILLALCAALPLVTIFLFKKRRLQMTLCRIEMVLLLVAQLTVAYMLWQARGMVEALGVEPMNFALTDVFPLVALIFTWLALRGIRRDEELVRSLDRIR